ncbi:MAG: histidine kinase [Bacteroidota bacterium]
MFKALWILTIVWVCFSNPIHAQNHNIDSLQKAIKHMPNDSNKVKALRDLAFGVVLSDREAGKVLTHEITTLSTQIHYAPGLAMAMDLNANMMRTEGLYNEAVDLHLRALRLYDSLQYEKGYISALVNIGNDYFYLNNKKKALGFYLQALSKLEASDYKKYVSIANNIGNIYTSEGKYKEAIALYLKALPSAHKDSTFVNQSVLYCSIGIAYAELRINDKAIDYLKQAIAYQKKSNNKLSCASTATTLASVLIGTGNYKEAKHYLDSGYQLALQIGARSVVSNYYRNMGELCFQTHKPAEAYAWQNRFIALNDSLINQSHVAQLAETETKFNVERKNKELALLQTANELKESELSKALLQKTIFIILLGAMFLLVFLLYRNTRLKKKTNQTLTTENVGLQTENIMAQYEILRSQISPHFLFNSLNALSSLIQTDVKKAAEFVTVFSKFYRNILSQKGDSLIPLHEELNLVDDYMYLQKIRFGNNLLLHKNIAAESMALFIPPFCLQMLIENALKHNTIEEEHPLQINIYSQQDYLIIENNLQIRTQKTNSMGVGIKNIMARFAILHNEAPRFETRDNKYIVIIPLIQAHTI